ncbi:alkaline phosphatase-like [Anthonomus grandis grandis]|uniref:alkaline phosphatase-like n=1 Tax=Anthonomus grandis grandis TaxID=2921223 RepID=UPI002165BD35|nr:alkaline phosphatase-like [Anthonomus grandis grandis]XP_050306489.1 alkaline phosphatase-like [Anthonomus grandis grandis]
MRLPFRFIFIFILIIFVVNGVSVTKNTKHEKVQDQEYWYEQARIALRKRLQYTTDRRPYAKNVILFVGDGMGIGTTTASRILSGQRLGKSGEDHELTWDTFPAVALAKTYNMDAQIGESSACATALMCGVKTNFETVGLDARGRFENCFSSFSSRVPSLIDWAQESGKSTGIVTNTRITHATPAALYGHAPSRYWEDDSKVPPASRKSCKDLARQLIENDPGRNINVLLGGGRRHWLPKVAYDPELTKEEGRRLDGRNLIDDWLREKKKRGLKAEYAWNKGHLEKLKASEVDYLLGLFSYSHMDFDVDRDPGPAGDPSLADMTRSALSILLKNPKGFLLVVEGGRIDHAHHYNNAYRALDETLAMDTAVLAALEMVNPTETLIVVTSDHSHVLTMGGQATPRGHPILGSDSKVSDVDGQPYTTILYGNGPGFATPRIVPMNTSSAVEDKNQVHGSAVPRQWGTHAGEDVPVYALGPLATTLFAGTFDQSYIPHAIAYSACIGEHRLRCKGLDNYAHPPVQNCTNPEVTSNSVHGQPLVVASSVRSDDNNHRVKSKSVKITVGRLINMPAILGLIVIMFK